MNQLNEKDILNLLSHTESLINHIYWVKQNFSLQPDKDHIATTINYSDLKERREDFVKDLINTITNWVYNKEKIKKIIKERLIKTHYDYGNASTFLAMQAFSKFRPGHPQGQFGELLLFNFIQYFFKAVPLLRKQIITTSIGHERFGADAIHYKKDGDKNIFLLGESKCYKSDYQFKSAFEASLKSIEKTFNDFDSELDLYTYDDFIEPELEEIVKAYKAGTLSNVFFELICLIAYNETAKFTGTNEAQIKSSILEIIQKQCKSIDTKIYSKCNDQILLRINYIIFPIWELDSLLQKFQKTIGK